ncbi:serine/threonine-protein kinase [Streptomyces sp. GSL17-111]|uniref:serine/threonine-protein kinase n=1 Tax=Streptomyces sp. GSL17-111 TaxID=3121596 RepID=UPI0030F4746E
MTKIGRGAVLGGRYQLEGQLGRGGMGQVWAGRDLRLHRPVAVKIAAAELLSDPDGRSRALRRFEREARVAASLEHANIATVHDADVTGSAYWIAMQLVQGATVDIVLGERDQERLDVPSAAALIAQLCAGLSAAHAADLVHRDLKPENVMIGRDGVVKILDFGLVKLLSDLGSRLTMTGEYVGNILYASPELLTGSRALDGRSDLYAVGCLLHHLLTGAPPFPRQQSARLVVQHLKESPPSAAARGVRIPAGLQGLLDGLLAKEPEDRPASAATVYAALAPYLPAPDPARATGTCAPEDPRRPFVLPAGPVPT